MNDKVCKHCGTSENLITHYHKDGKIVIMGFCRSCWYDLRHNQWINKSEEEKAKVKNNISIGTKEAMALLPEETKEKIKYGYVNGFLSKLSDEEKKEHYRKNGIAIINSPKEPERKRKISEFQQNMSQEEKDRRHEKTLQTLENLSEQVKEERRKRKSDASKRNWESKEYKIKQVNSTKITLANRTKEEKQENSKNRSIGHKNFLLSLTEEERKDYEKRKLDKFYQTINSEKWKSTTGRKVSERVREQNLKRLEENAKTGKCFQSKAEKSCLDYIKSKIDPNVDYQKRYGNWMIDFYLPKYDLYVQFDGVFWHGLSEYKEGFFETPMGKAILKTKEKDRKQDEQICNLIRITDIEFKQNPLNLDNKIKPKVMNKIMNLMY